MFRRRVELLLTREELDGLIVLTMRIDEDVEAVLELLRGDDDWEEEEDRS